MEFDACDWSIYKLRELNIDRSTKGHPTTYLITYAFNLTVSRGFLSAFFYLDFSVVWPNDPKAATELPEVTGLELGETLQTIDAPFSKQSLVSKLKCSESPFLDAYIGTALPACMWGMKSMWSRELDQKTFSHQQS